jgi:hypothetical protein
MNKFWKISNTQNVDTKVAVATASNGSIGIILKPNQFCVSLDQMTKMIDAQEKRGFVSVDKEYKNEYDLETGISFDEGYIPENYAQIKVQEYKESN